MITTYKFKMKPTASQKEYFAKCFGCARFVYNHALRENTNAYSSEKKSLLFFDLCANIRELRRQLEYGWLFGGIYARLIPAFNELGWERTNTDDVDRFFAAMFRDREVVNRNTAEVMHIPLSLSEMTTVAVEMSEYCERPLDFCRENFPAIDVEELLPENYRKKQGGEGAA